MTTLNPQYISSTPLQWSFWNKDGTGALGDGIVKFFHQNAQAVLKPIYQLDNSSPTGFSELNNPIQLTAIGTFADDNGNDIVPYFYPFDQFGNPDLYFVEVYSSTGVFQFSRQDWPPALTEEGAITNQNDIVNYVPNGQFLLHNNNPVIAINQGSSPPSIGYFIAPGGWTFEAQWTSPETADTIDTITFLRQLESSAPNELIDANPRYYVQIATSGNDPNYARKDLCLFFPDVNKFSGNTLTFSWQGYASSGGTPTVTIVLIQYFGSSSATYSPSNTLETVIGTQIINSSNSIYNISITFPSNLTNTVSPSVDNDYLKICLRLPNSQQTVQFTDFVLTPSTPLVTAFPLTPNDIFIEQSTIGYLPTPAYDGSDLYLPLVLTPQGTAPDYSVVGTIIGKTQAPTNSNFGVNNELLMNGATYVASAYSPIGIPYQRLMNYLLLNSPAVTIVQSGLTAVLNAGQVPMYGTGPNFVTLFYKSGVTTGFFLQLNTAVAGTAAQGTTGWTFTATVANTTYTISALTVPTAGQYWTFTDGLAGLVYNVWYSINGVGTAPAAPTGANIQVNLTGTPTDITTINATIAAVNGYQFAILDARGYFWRGLDTAAAIDLDYAARTISGITFDTTVLTSILGARTGSLEAQAFLNHTHTNTLSAVANGSHSTSGGNSPVMNGPTADISTAGSVTISGSIGTSSTGGDETRPVNLSLNWFIKY